MLYPMRNAAQSDFWRALNEGFTGQLWGIIVAADEFTRVSCAPGDGG
jgi:hypothetical protein